MHRVTLIETDTGSAFFWDVAGPREAVEMAVQFVGEGMGTPAAYHVSQEPTRTVYSLGNRDAHVEPPLHARER